MACDTDRFAASGPVGGGEIAECTERRATSILHLHGASDTVVPIEGDPDGLGHPAVQQTLAQWRTAQGCQEPAVTTDGGVRRFTATCAAGHEVGLIVVAGLAHTWPTASDGLDGARTLWEFFARHRQ